MRRIVRRQTRRMTRGSAHPRTETQGPCNIYSHGHIIVFAWEVGESTRVVNMSSHAGRLVNMLTASGGAHPHRRRSAILRPLLLSEGQQSNNGWDHSHAMKNLDDVIEGIEGRLDEKDEVRELTIKSSR